MEYSKPLQQIQISVIIMEDKTIMAMFAVGCITALEAIALMNGINGAFFTMSIGAIAGIMGYEIKAIKDFILKKQKLYKVRFQQISWELKHGQRSKVQSMHTKNTRNAKPNAKKRGEDR